MVFQKRSSSTVGGVDDLSASVVLDLGCALVEGPHMNAIDDTKPVAGLRSFINDALTINVYPEGDTCVVHAAGELDIASGDQLLVAATAGRHPATVIDLADLTFMDCGGYRSLVASRVVIEQQGRSLSVRGQTGEPARLLNLIAELETSNP